MRRIHPLTLIIVGIALTAGVISGLYKTSKRIFVFESYNFNKDYWILKHGSEMDSFAYIIDDRQQLKEVKSEVTMEKSSEQFATTGGYSFSLYQNGERVLVTDLIPDKGFDDPGKLYSSVHGTLEYSNLKWFKKPRFNWTKVKCVPKSFSSEEEIQHFEDSLYEICPIRWIDESHDHGKIHITYLIEQ